MTQQRATPGLVNWLGYLAITLLVILPLAVLMVRSGAWQQGLLLYAISCLGASLLLIFSLWLMMFRGYAPWRSQIAMRAALNLPGALLLLGMTLGGGDHPRIHDITTTPDNPPRFVTAAEQRGEDANSLELKADTPSPQRQATPDPATNVTSIPIDDAFEKAARTAETMGWEIYHRDANAGIIEAVDTTAIMGFKDDIVIRVRSNAEGTLIDLRSVSRVGLGDLGANAKRIRAFRRAFEA